MLGEGATSGLFVCGMQVQYARQYRDKTKQGERILCVEHYSILERKECKVYYYFERTHAPRLNTSG